MTSAHERPILITGGAGFIGSNLADRLASEGHRVRIYDALARPGVQANLEWLTSRHDDRVEPVIADIRDADSLTSAVREVGAVFHFAAQVAVTDSMQMPRHDLETNILGTFNLLDALRLRREAVPVLFASTNKVYGDLTSFGSRLATNGYRPADIRLANRGVNESQPLDFHTPYGCSKGAADQYVLDYARSFKLPAVVLRMSCVYGERQMGTEDQGWVAHFLIRALRGQPITIFGDGHQVRDILAVQDAVAAYLAAWRRIDRVAGRAFNLGGGPANAVSLLRLVEYIRQITGRPVPLEFGEWRSGDQRWYVTDTRLAENELGLPPRLGWKEGIRHLSDWLVRERDPAPQSPGLRSVEIAR